MQHTVPNHLCQDAFVRYFCQGTMRSCHPRHWRRSVWRKNLDRGWGCVSSVLMKQSEILKARKQLVQELADPAEILRGSLLDRKVFHRRRCLKCRRGEGHTVWVLTIGYSGGRTRQSSIRPGQRKQVERWVRNYQRLKAKLEAICELNHQLSRAEP